MKDVQELNIEIERIHADIRLIENSISQIENNHLVHIVKSIDNINKVLWATGFAIFTQLILIVRQFLLGA